MDTLVKTLYWELYHIHNAYSCTIKETADIKNKWILLFPLEGEMTLYDTAHNKIHQIESGACNLLFIPNAHTIFYDLMPNNKEGVRFLQIVLSSGFLKKLLTASELRTQYLTEQEDTIGFYNFCNKSINASIRFHIDLLLNDMSNTFYNKICLEASIMQIVVGLITLFKANNTCATYCSLKPYHYEKIQKAEKLIRENIQEPCSLIALARQVGTNDCTLKKGFKELYGTTIFNYFKDIRMEKAMDLLKTTDLDIGQIADELGYKNHSNFSQTFKKKYGYSPKSVREYIPS